MHRGWTPYFAVFLTLWSLSILTAKLIGIRRQRPALDINFMPTDTSLDTSEEVDRVLNHIDTTSNRTNDRILGHRIRRAIEHFISSRNAKEVGDILRDENESDLGELEDSYVLLRAFLWAIPILGFVGTVLGVSAAVGGFANFLSGVATVEQIKDALGSVTSGLSVAFDTTFVALCLSLLVMLFMSMVEKLEIGQLRQIDEYCQRNILHRLPTERARPKSDMDLLLGSLQHMMKNFTSEISKLGRDDAAKTLGDQRETIAEIIRSQDKIVQEYTKLLNESRTELEGLMKSRNDLTQEIMTKPELSSLPETLVQVQNLIRSLEPTLRRLAEKPLEVDVHLVAGQISTTTRQSGTSQP